MTTVTRTFSWLNANSTDLNAWVNEVHATMIAAGMTQAADTGQIALSGLTWVNSASTNYGYEIWKFPDALQATTPIFIKFEYMNNSSTASKVALRVSVASSTDGAGALTTTAGPIHGPYVSAVTGTFVASRVTYACYTDGTFSLILGKDIASSSTTQSNALASMTIDRKRNSAGVAQSGAYLAMIGAYAGSVSTRHCYGASTLAVTSPPFFWPHPASTTTVDGSNVNLMRGYLQAPGIYPSLGALGYFYSEVSDITPQTVTLLGASHVYLPVGRAFSGMRADNSADTCAMIRWE